LKTLKTILGLTLLVALGLLILNMTDVAQSLELKKMTLQQEKHLNQQNSVSLKELIPTIASAKEMQSLSGDLRSKEIRCFVYSTCSNADYNKALSTASNILKNNKSLLAKFQQEISNINAVSLPFDASFKDNLFFRFDSFLQLQMIEINYLFSRTNEDRSFTNEALLKAQTFDSFLLKSLYHPNFNLTSMMMLRRLKHLRVSLQKYSPNRLKMKKVDAEKIIQSVQTGEFIAFSNHLDKIIEKRKGPFISINRTLNQYVAINNKNAKDDCVYNSKKVFCVVTKVNSLSLINPVGKQLLKNIATSSLHYKKFVAAANKINNLNL